MTFKQIIHHLNRRDTHLFPHPKPLAKFILIFTIIISSVFLTKKILAENINTTGSVNFKIDTSEFTNSYLNKQEAIETGNNQESWIEESLTSNTVSFNKAFIGNLKRENLTGPIRWTPGGLIGMTNNAIASLYNPPISGIQYIAHVIDGFLGKPTYAATGFGFGQMSTFMTIWKNTRDFVYTLISVFFVILGILIMFRIKINAQATITIQSMIPKIVTTLILVTFSYAIAGLLIDFSYVVLGLILNIFIKKNINIDNVSYNTPDLMQLNFMGVRNLANVLVPFETRLILGIVVGTVVTVATGVVGGWILGLLSGSLALLGISFFVFIQTLKFFMGIAKCYFLVIIKIIFAPLEIAAGVLPNSKVNFSSWIKSFVANLAVFPAGVIFLVLVNIILATIKTTSGDKFWVPEMLGTGIITQGILGLAAISIFSKIPQIVPQFFGVKPTLDKTLGDSFKTLPGVTAVTGSFRTMKDSAMRYMSSQGVGWATFKKGLRRKDVPTEEIKTQPKTQKIYRNLSDVWRIKKTPKSETLISKTPIPEAPPPTQVLRLNTRELNSPSSPDYLGNANSAQATFNYMKKESKEREKEKSLLEEITKNSK